MQWNQPAFIELLREIDPYTEMQYFRPLNKAYDGNNTFWSIPSPEPKLNDQFWESVKARFDDRNIKNAICRLANRISLWEPNPALILFVSILRAGVPISDWLCRLLPGSAAAAISLFVGLGIDRIALNEIYQKYPDRRIIFVDGWTGRGGVARIIAELNSGPLAVLNDPWGWADFSGSREDILCPSACFTGTSTLGFSRTFFVNDQSKFAAWRFPEKYCRYDVVQSWQMHCPTIDSFLNGQNYNLDYGDTDQNAFLKSSESRFYRETELRIHSNEVCRALINADPETLYFLDDASIVRQHYGLLLELAEMRHKPVVYHATFLEKLKTKVGCTMNTVG